MILFSRALQSETCNTLTHFAKQMFESINSLDAEHLFVDSYDSCIAVATNGAVGVANQSRSRYANRGQLGRVN